MKQDFEDTWRRRLTAALSFQLTRDPFALFRGEPASLLRAVREVVDRDDSQHDGGGTLQQKQPAPAFDAQPVNLQEHS
jgi:hypothetical protein